MTDDDKRQLIDLLEKKKIALLKYLRVLGCCSSDTNDVLQEAGLKICKASSFKFQDDSKTTAWLKTVVKHAYFELVRKRRGVHVGIEAELLDELLLPEDPNDTIAALRHCIEHLRGDSRQILDDKFGHTEIGNKNWTAATFQRYATLLAHLRDCIQGRIAHWAR